MSYDIWLEVDLGGPEPSEVDVLDWNYTSNCARMWRKAMPETEGLAGMNGMKAGDALPHLEQGIARMVASSDEFRALNPSNGWGDFDSQLGALRELVAAFKRAPAATVVVSR